MACIRSRFIFILIVALAALVVPTVAAAQAKSAAERARETEAQMTDDERFGMIEA